MGGSVLRNFVGINIFELFVENFTQDVLFLICEVLEILNQYPIQEFIQALELFLRVQKFLKHLRLVLQVQVLLLYRCVLLNQGFDATLELIFLQRGT